MIKQLADIRAGNRDNPTMYPFALPESIGDAQALADVVGGDWEPYDHGALIYPYYVLRGFDPPRLRRPTQMPGVLSEGLFLSNEHELELLKRPRVRAAMAVAYYDAVARYLARRGAHVGYELVAGPVEAVGAVGGGQIARVRFAVIPQVLPTIVAYWLYRFEINIRASAVLGLVGAGGIGAEIVARLSFRADWPKAGAALIATIVVVLLVDTASSAIRRRIITGQPSTSMVSKGMIAITGAGRAPSTELTT